MRGDWMDEARRFEDIDKAIMESLMRENDYWKRVGGHPPVGHQDAPPAMLECCEDAIERGEATCVFGCGSAVDTDHGMCLTCREHSTNRLECDCGRAWEQWNGEWEPAK